MGINTRWPGRGVRMAAALLALAWGLGGGAGPARALTESSFLENLPGSHTDVLLVSDIHFNPLLVAAPQVPALAARLADAPVEQWRAILDAAPALPLSIKGQDTDWTLFRSALGAMHTADPHPGMVIQTGDLLAHDFRKIFNAALPAKAHDDAAYGDFVRKTVRFVMGQLETAYPKVPLVNTIGNNDSTCGDYGLSPGSDLLQATAADVAADAGVPGDARVMADWQTAGDYDIAHPLLADTRILVFDSVGLSARYRNKCGSGDGKLAHASLAWLHERLAAAHAAGQKVWIITHIPPGMNAFTMAKQWDGHACVPAAPFYAPEWESAFEREVMAWPGTVRLILAGHTHMDEVRLLGEGADAVPVLITPGISPNHGQNPAFKRARLSYSGRLTDMVTYAYAETPARLRLEEGPPRWRMEYDMARTWAVKDLTSPDAIRAIIKRLAREVDWSRYRRAFATSADDVAGPTPANGALYRCVMSHSSVEEAQRCVCTGLTP